MSFEDPRFRIHRKFRSGHEVFILGQCFNSTGSLIHWFSDHMHARNFCRYLFSQTQRHPQNHLTPRNVVCEYHDRKQTAGDPLLDPPGRMKAFLGSRFPKQKAHRQLCDDGAYVSFVFLEPNGTCISNFLQSEEDGEIFFNLHFVNLLQGTQEEGDIATGIVEKGTSLIAFDEVEPEKRIWFVDRMIQSLVSDHLGGDPVMTVSHRDQLDHNQIYHIHRLLRVPPET